jgi:hypothetical protein
VVRTAGSGNIVEDEIVIFESDIPAQHIWMPERSQAYRVICRGVVMATVN